MKKIVVFGATGDVGRYFIDWLLAHKVDYEICAVGHRKEFHIFDYAPNVSYYSVDISRKEDFEVLPSNPFAIVDFAGLMPARKSAASFSLRILSASCFERNSRPAETKAENF